MIGALLAMPLGAEAQQAGKVYQVGFVSLGTHPTRQGMWAKLMDAMRELGYAEGQNLIVRRALAEGNPERLPALVAELVQAKVNVIVTTSTPETLAAKRASATMPIVMTRVPDPVEQGPVASLARPGNNVTGLTTMAPGTSQKLVELLREAVPAASRFGVLRSGASPFPEIRRELPRAAQQTGIPRSYIEGINAQATSIRSSRERSSKVREGSSLLSVLSHTDTAPRWRRLPSSIGCPGSIGAGISWRRVVSCPMGSASATWANAPRTSLTGS
jgi:putative ABC transport system substrate-binding protein